MVKKGALANVSQIQLNFFKGTNSHVKDALLIKASCHRWRNRTQVRFKRRATAVLNSIDPI